MPVSMFGDHHTRGVSVHRAAALATGAAGAYVPVVFDAVNDNVVEYGASLAGGVVTVDGEGAYCTGGLVTVGWVLGVTGAGVRVLRSGVVVYEAEQQGLTLAMGAILQFPFCLPIRLDSSGTVEVHVASFGAGGVPLVVGREKTFVTTEAI